MFCRGPSRAACSGIELAFLSIECRYTICQLSFVFPSLEYQETTGSALANAIVRDVPGFVTGGKIDPSLRGEAKQDHWIQGRAPE